MFTPRTKTLKTDSIGAFLCSEIGGNISQIYWLSLPYESPVDSVSGVGSWRNRRRQPSLYPIHSNTDSVMPRTESICVRANNSTPFTAYAHDTGALVSVHDGQAVTTSLQVAEVFNKQHKEVLRSIRGLECSSELRERNFALSCYTCKNGNVSKTNPMYYIGRDGFVFLVMGFTGKIAARFKEEYIRQFNEMEEMLRKSRETQYASRLLDAQVERFSRDLKAIVRRRQMDGHRYYGPAGELRTGFFYDRNEDFGTKLETVFSQVKNAYLDGFHFVEDMKESQKRLDAIGGTVREFIEGIHGKVDIW